MKNKILFRERSIRYQIKIIIVITLCLLAVLCVLINQSVKQLLYNNADEYTKITSSRLRDQIAFDYDKIQSTFLSIIDEDSVWQFMTRSYVDMAAKICAGLDEAKANWWLNRIRKENRWDKTCRILGEIRNNGMKDFTVRSCLKLSNLIYSKPPFQDAESDYYIYSIKQMVMEYGTFEHMLEQLDKSLKEMGNRAEQDTAFTNRSFMKLMQYVNSHYKENISLSSAAESLYMSPNYISQLFKKETGITFVHYVTQRRLEDARKMLTTTELPVTDIAVEVGFNDYFYFIKTFKKFTGMTPTQYRRQM